MTPTAELRTFLADPVGKALIGPSWLYFCARPELFGIVLWGRPGSDDVDALVRALKVELGPAIVPHASFVDASRVDSVDLGAFEGLSSYVTEFAGALSTAVTRLALVRPSGMAGAITAGFYEVSGLPYAVEIFDDAPAALAWLQEAESLAAELDAMIDDVRGTAVIAAQLRAWIRTRIRDAELPDAARALAVSERTLQRRLREAGTTFAAELLSTRLAEAKRRMRDSDAPLSTIAFEAGFSSQQHLSGAFRRAFGETPSGWRSGLSDAGA